MNLKINLIHVTRSLKMEKYVWKHTAIVKSLKNLRIYGA